MEHLILYLCDPAKNKDCRKTGCKFNPTAVHPLCESTRNPAFAVLDECGNAVLAWDSEKSIWHNEKVRRSLEWDAEESDFNRSGRTYAVGVVRAIVNQSDITNAEKIDRLKYFLGCLDRRNEV